VELYEQVAGTTDETKKYFTTYNTLQNTKDFIIKECKVMDRQVVPPPFRWFLTHTYHSQRVRPVSKKFRQEAVCREHGGHFERRYRSCSASSTSPHFHASSRA
jgi:hypothetical protein